MATILISAYACKFSRSNGFRCMEYAPLDAPIYRDKLEASQVRPVLDAMKRLQERLSTEQPQRSFFISARVIAGRSPSGFKRVPRFDYDAQPLIEAVDNAVAELADAGVIARDKAVPRVFSLFGSGQASDPALT